MDWPTCSNGHKAHWPPCGALPDWYGRTIRTLMGDWVLDAAEGVWRWVAR